MSAEPTRARRKLAAIVMVDVSGFSRLMARDEEWTTREIQRFHARVLARVVEFEGRVVDTAGDSVFSEFDSVVQATRCAQAIQDDQAQRNGEVAPAQRFETRIGVHVGDVIVEEFKIYGDGVNIAARLETLAQPGEIVVSEAVYQQVHNKIDAQFRDSGVQRLKNIEHPVRVYRLVPSALVASAPRPVPAHVRPRTRREERLARRSRPRATLPDGHEYSGPPPAPLDVLLRPDVATPALLGVFLLLAPLIGLSTAGVFPTGGAILLGLTLGRALERVRRRRGLRLVGLGLGLAAGALFTRWSAVTNVLLLIAGAVVALQGLALARRFAPLPPAVPPETPER